MTLEQAIEIKSRRGDAFLKTPPSEIAEANKLSLEALNHIKRSRELPPNPDHPLLPGETKE